MTSGMKKGNNDTADNIASMKTAATVGNNGATKAENSTFGISSPFKDALQKGIVSGMGLLLSLIHI